MSSFVSLVHVLVLVLVVLFLKFLLVKKVYLSKDEDVACTVKVYVIPVLVDSSLPLSEVMCGKESLSLSLCMKIMKGC